LSDDFISIDFPKLIDKIKSIASLAPSAVPDQEILYKNQAGIIFKYKNIS